MHLIAGGGDDALGRAADAPQQRRGRARRDREQRAGDVAVGDQAHAPAGVADGLDALLVARAVEHDDHHVADVHAAALGHELDGLAERAVEVEQVGDLVAAGHLLHVDARAGVEHRAALGQRDHGQRVRHAERAQPRALERVDGDVDLRVGAVADLLAVGQHRRLVLLALADDDDAVHVDRVEDGVHAVDGRLVGGFLVAAADVARGGQRGRLGDAHELEREVAIGDVARWHQHSTPGGLRGRSVVEARIDAADRDHDRAEEGEEPADPELIWLGGSPGRSTKPT